MELLADNEVSAWSQLLGVLCETRPDLPLRCRPSKPTHSPAVRDEPVTFFRLGG